jgi:hypothetical protein
MKKKILGKLTLGKRSIASLTPESMTQVQGGISIINDDDETCGCPRPTRRNCNPQTVVNCPSGYYTCNYSDGCGTGGTTDSRPCP